MIRTIAIGSRFKSCCAYLAASFITLLSSNSFAEECYSSFEDADYEVSRSSCQEIAEQGDAKAAFLLATIYYQGLDTEKNEQRALFWDEVAAEKGHPDSAYRLALIYQLGQGVTQSNSQARRWYMQAALANHPKAQKQLGVMFETGAAGEVNLKNAYEWYLKAARQGLADAQLRAGTMLHEGRGVEQNKAHAQHWIRKAAEAGNPNAQVALGVLLAEVDPVESFSWYEKSAATGNGLALYNMALAYYSGQGVNQDQVKAREIAQQALDAGNEDARNLIENNQIEKLKQRIAELQTEKQQITEQMLEVMPETASGEKEEPELLASSGTVSPVSTASQSPSQQSENAADYYMDDGWIMQQKPTRFTVQLANGDVEKGIHTYIKQSGLSEGLKYYRTQREAGTFFVLIYGEYPTMDAAKAAVKQLPESIRKDYWIRQFGQLQAVYRQP